MVVHPTALYPVPDEHQSSYYQSSDSSIPSSRSLLPPINPIRAGPPILILYRYRMVLVDQLITPHSYGGAHRGSAAFKGDAPSLSVALPPLELPDRYSSRWLVNKMCFD